MSARAALCILAMIAVARAASAQPQAAPSIQPIPLKQLVERYIAWRGGDGFVRLKTVHSTGAVEAAGLVGRFESWQTDTEARNETEIGGVRIVEVTTPRQSWTTNASGQVVDVPDGFKYASRDPSSASTLTGKDNATAMVLGVEPLDGRNWEVVRVQYGDADTYDDFLDPATGALGAVRASEKGQGRLEHYSDWRPVAGVRMPFVTRIASPSVPDQTVRVLQLDVGARLDPSLFTRPESQRRATFAGGATSSGWIAFVGARPDRVYLPITIDGQAMTAIFDTGATSTAIDAGVLALLNHSSAGAFPVSGENGVGSAAIAKGVDVHVGALSLRGLTVASLDLKSIAARAGEPWSVVLGDEVFNETVVDIDFPNRQVAFRDPRAFKPPRGAITVTLMRDGDTRLAPLSLNGGPPALFIMDTGFSDNLRIAPALAERQNLMAGQAGRPITIGAIGGDAKGVIGEIPSVELGGISFPNVSAIFSDTWPSATYTNRVDGLLGLGLLARFRVIVDWPHDRLFLIPSPATAPTRF